MISSHSLCPLHLSVHTISFKNKSPTTTQSPFCSTNSLAKDGLMLLVGAGWMLFYVSKHRDIETIVIIIKAHLEMSDFGSVKNLFDEMPKRSLLIGIERQ